MLVRKRRFLLTIYKDATITVADIEALSDIIRT